MIEWVSECVGMLVGGYVNDRVLMDYIWTLCVTTNQHQKLIACWYLKGETALTRSHALIKMVNSHQTQMFAQMIMPA